MMMMMMMSMMMIFGASWFVLCLRLTGQPRAVFCRAGGDTEHQGLTHSEQAPALQSGRKRIVPSHEDPDGPLSAKQQPALSADQTMKLRRLGRILDVFCAFDVAQDG